MAKKKKKSLLRDVARILFVLLLLLMASYFIITFLSKPPHIKYPAFGTDIPPNYAVHGIDVSHYQRLIDWEDVRDMQVKDIKIGFVFIKATEGIENVDDQFRRNWLQAEEMKIVKGAYHYFIAGKSGKLQARNFIQIVPLKKGDLPPVLDIEQISGNALPDLRKEIKKWLDEVEGHYGIKPVIYTNVDFYNNNLKGSFDEYQLWIAHYLQPEKPRLQHKWMFWQHSESGRVNGIKAPVDFNVFSGDSIDFRNSLIK
ncbi:MAG: GH25 family lysozyme [Ginsengibacter sp.]